MAPIKVRGRNKRGVSQPGSAEVQARYRIIDFKRRDKEGVVSSAAIEYDPNRTANIALLHY